MGITDEEYDQNYRQKLSLCKIYIRFSQYRAPEPKNQAKIRRGTETVL